MKRRRLLIAGLASLAGLVSRNSWGQAENYAAPKRFSKPELDTDEGGMWAQMERQERNLRRSPLLVRDAGLKDYVQDLACRLGGEHCPDVRVHLVRTPLFNASMAPNGMMQVWTGLLLRMENEAQLAAVLGHEIAHYLQRHSVERLRDLKAKAAFGQFLGLFGVVGAVGQLAVLASSFAYSREHEREADRIGAYLMHQAGYDVAESAVVWANLLDEAKARQGREPDQNSPLFATHPVPPERREALAELAKKLPEGSKGEISFAEKTKGFLDEWLSDEVKRGQHEESLVLLNRMLLKKKMAALVYFHRAEIYRLRAKEGDLDLAISDYRSAIKEPNPVPAAWRGVGLIARQRNENAEALEAFVRYLELSPQAADAELIKNYILELKS